MELADRGNVGVREIKACDDAAIAADFSDVEDTRRPSR